MKIKLPLFLFSLIFISAACSKPVQKQDCPLCPVCAAYTASVPMYEPDYNGGPVEPEYIEISYQPLHIQPAASVTKLSFTGADVGKSYFAYGKAELTEEYKQELKELARTIKGDKNVFVSVEGHTDSVSSQEFNQKLSERRAKAVADFLVQQGVDKASVSYKGYGKLRPAASNDTAEGRAKNRRVDIYISRI